MTRFARLLFAILLACACALSLGQKVPPKKGAGTPFGRPPADSTSFDNHDDSDILIYVGAGVFFLVVLGVAVFFSRRKLRKPAEVEPAASLVEIAIVLPGATWKQLADMLYSAPTDSPETREATMLKLARAIPVDDVEEGFIRLRMTAGLVGELGRDVEALKVRQARAVEAPYMGAPIDTPEVGILGILVACPLIYDAGDGGAEKAKATIQLMAMGSDLAKPASVAFYEAPAPSAQLTASEAKSLLERLDA